MSSEQIILSAQETCSLYDRLKALEKKANKAVALYEALDGIKKPSSGYLIDFFGDAGTINANQDQLAARMFEDDPYLIFMAGDNTYTDPGDCDTVHADMAVFDNWRSRCRLYPALGNHDLDVDPISECHYNLYTYLSGNRRYYTKYFHNTGVQIFSINSGYDSTNALIEPDGNIVGSAQYRWFVDEVLKSTAKWKIVMFHHPIFSQMSGSVSGSAYHPEMDWSFERYGIDLVINGHSHLNVHHRLRGLDYVQISAPVRTMRETRNSTDTPYGDADTELIYKDNRGGPHLGLPSHGRLYVTPLGIKVEFVDMATGITYYCFGITNCRTQAPDCILPDDYCDPCSV